MAGLSLALPEPGFNRTAITMKRQGLRVDFGPISLAQVGNADSAPDHYGSLSLDDSEDAFRLRTLLARKKDLVESDERVELVVGKQVDATIVVSADEYSQYPENAARLVKLAYPIVQSSMAVATTISLEVVPDLLPGTRLTIQKGSYGINFDLHISDPKVLESLAKELDHIASDVGAVLGLNVRLRLFGGDQVNPQKSSFG